MAKQNSNNKQLKAQDVYQLVNATLQEHFQLDMTNREYTTQTIWDVLVAASVERISIEMASQLLEAAPSGTIVRTLVKGMLQDVGQLTDVEKRLNELLTTQLPRKLLKSKLPAAIDLTELPYHGQHPEDDPYVRRGRAKSGTTHFYVFATLYIVKKSKRYTLAIVLVRQTEKAQDVVECLLARGDELELRIKRLYLDRGFDNNGLVAHLKKRPFPTIIPLVVRGKQGGWWDARAIPPPMSEKAPFMVRKACACTLFANTARENTNAKASFVLPTSSSGHSNDNRLK